MGLAVLGQRVAEGSGRPILLWLRLGTATCRGLWQRAPGPRHSPSLDPGPSSAPASPPSDAARKLSYSQLLPPCDPIQGVSLPQPLAISPHFCPLSTVHSPDLVQSIIFFSQVLHRCPAVLDSASPSYSSARSTAEMNMPCSLSTTIHGSYCSED